MMKRIILLSIIIEAIAIKASPFLHKDSNNILLGSKNSQICTCIEKQKTKLNLFEAINIVTKNSDENHLTNGPLIKKTLCKNCSLLNNYSGIKRAQDDSNYLNKFLLTFDSKAYFESEVSNANNAYRYSMLSISIIPMYRIRRFEVGAGVQAELGINSANPLQITTTRTTKSLGFAINYNNPISPHLKYILISRLYAHDYKYKVTSNRVTQYIDNGYSCLIGAGLTFAGKSGSVSPVIYMNGVSKNDITNPYSELLLSTGVLVNVKCNIRRKS